MASAVTPPRQLAPTVGLTEALAGVHIQTGSPVHFDIRVLSGLVVRLGEMAFVSDNAGCFRNKPFPVKGCLIDFGGFTTYVATEVICSYPDVVLEAEDPPMLSAAQGPCAGRSPSSVAVMMVGKTEEVFQDAPDGDAGMHRVRLAKPPQERGAARDGDP